MRAVLLSVAVLAWAAPAWTATPERKVEGHTVYSSLDPHVEVHLPEDVTFVGSDTFSLNKPELGDFDVCELFAFANGEKDGSLRKFYWVHFEHLLPNHPEMHFTYDSPRHVKIGGLDFFVDVDYSDGTNTPKPGSDTEHFYTLLAAHGYKRVPMMFVRLVHLTDTTNRKELMIILGEALPPGVTSASLGEGGKDHARWAVLERALIRSALRNISITAPPKAFFRE